MSEPDFRPLFYTCHLKAAFMAKYHGMRYLMQEPGGDGSYTITAEHEQGMRGMGDSPDYIRLDFGSWAVPDKHYIHPKSLCLLDPQMGDYAGTGSAPSFS